MNALKIFLDISLDKGGFSSALVLLLLLLVLCSGRILLGVAVAVVVACELLLLAVLCDKVKVAFLLCIFFSQSPSLKNVPLLILMEITLLLS